MEGIYIRTYIRTNSVKPVIDGMDTLKNEQDSFKQKFIEIDSSIGKCIDLIRKNANDISMSYSKNTYAGSLKKYLLINLKKIWKI